MFLDVEIIEGDLLQRFMMIEKGLIKVNTKIKRSDGLFRFLGTERKTLNYLYVYFT